MILTIQEAEDVVREMDPNVREEDVQVGGLLIASAVIGNDEQALAVFTGYEPDFIATCGRRLRDNGVWVGDELCVDWWDEETGGVAFWMDVCIAQGLMRRARRERHGQT